MALGAQGLSRSRPVAPSGSHLHRSMQRMGILQIDSVNVFARSHHMPLFSRLGAYDQQTFERLFHSNARHYVEYLAHEAAFMPTSDWALWRFRMDDFRKRWSGEGSWLSQNQRTVSWVRDELLARGPLRPADLRDDAPRERGTWWDWDDAKLALEHLWRVGDVAISGRRGFERRYALAEQVIPEEVLSRPVPRDEAVRELVSRAARYSGVATEADLADYHRLRDRAAVRAAIGDLVDAGELESVTVSGWERNGKVIPAWRHRDAALPRRIDNVALLTPFDPVVWFRERALRIFELDYRIEIYVPADKRRFGYYSLPVLVGDRIAARVDLKADRANATLLVQSAWWEPHAKPGDEEPVAHELMRAASWQGLTQITVSRWGDATDAIAGALGAGRHAHAREES